MRRAYRMHGVRDMDFRYALHRLSGSPGFTAVRMVLRAGGVLIAAGLALGVLGAYLMTRYLETLLVEIPRTDPLTYALVIVTLGAIGTAAAWVPARRATRVDPVVALRTE